MRFSSLSLCLATLALAAPATAQTGSPGPLGASATPEVHATAPVTARPSKAAIEADRRMIAEQKRLERIMTICNGC